MNVSACLVTRGDVDMTPITDSLTASGIDDIVVWDNSEREDLAVYGRYAAIAEAKHELIYVQDDDCVVSDPAAIAAAWMQHAALSPGEPRDFERGHVVANMPSDFRHNFYSDHCLVGFGTVFHRDLPERAFRRWEEHVGIWDDDLNIGNVYQDGEFFDRTCDIVFTGLTPRILVDVEYQDLPWAHDSNRMWKQNGHVAERQKMLDLVRQVRDA